MCYALSTQTNHTQRRLSHEKQTIGVIMMGYRRSNAGMRANKQTHMLGFGEVGGVGQLVYHSFRFADYEIDYLKDGT